MRLGLGTKVDRYIIEGWLGAGGMASVYLARHSTLDSRHALKVLEVRSREIQQRLLLEGRAQSSLRHPNIVSVTDVIDARGQMALIMELVEGPNLEQLLGRGRLSAAQVDHIARGILDGVAAAHRAGVIHRDLKPSNVLLAVHGDTLLPKVADFGLAKSSASNADVRTRSGTTMGTPAYMAPEQIRDASTVDHRADIFSLGAILYELVTGRRAFEGQDTLDLLTAVAEGTYVPPRDLVPDLPEPWNRAICDALRVSVDERTPDVDTLLRTWTGETAAASSPGWAPEQLTEAASMWTDRQSLPPASDDTWMPAESRGPSAPTFSPSLSEPLDASISDAPPYLRAALLGLVLAAPVVLGVLTLMYGDAMGAMAVGGLVMAPIVSLGVAAIVAAPVMALMVRAGRPLFIAWLALPALTIMAGAIGSALGAHEASLTMQAMTPESLASFRSTAVSAAMVPDCTGMIMAASAFAISLPMAAWSVRPQIDLARIPARSVAALVLAGLGGAVLWWFMPRFVAGAEAGGAQLFVIAVLVLGAACGGVTSHRPTFGRTELAIALATALACTAASHAAELVTISRMLASIDHADPVRQASGAIDSLDSLSLVPPGVWGAVGWIVALLPLVGRRPEGLKQLSLWVLPFLFGIAGIGSRVVATYETAAIGRQVVPEALAHASRWHLGVSLVDTLGGPTVQEVGAGAALLPGDRVLSVQDRTVTDTLGLLELISDCGCGTDAACELQSTCLQPGDAVGLLVARRTGAGEFTQVIEATLRYGADPSP